MKTCPVCEGDGLLERPLCDLLETCGACDGKGSVTDERCLEIERATEPHPKFHGQEEP